MTVRLCTETGGVGGLQHMINKVLRHHVWERGLLETDP